ncbi:hypothetical protein [Nocardia noduli]|uniref:hypothetical protein n=1 Tax=Nocardia noduli TaxID=2815722 RepID=UPI001C2290C3|nr:hypothetical protein [Nocardia noduli]
MIDAVVIDTVVDDAVVDEVVLGRARQWDLVQEEPDVTPEQEAVLHDIQTQLRGPGSAGWPQLGSDAEGNHRTLVEGIAAALRRIGELEEQTAALRAQTTALRAQVGELRTEISELEATSAELAAEVRNLESRQLPWPLSLIEGPAEFVGAQLNRLEALLPGHGADGKPAAPDA